MDDIQIRKYIDELAEEIYRAHARSMTKKDDRYDEGIEQGLKYALKWFKQRAGITK